MTDIRIGSGLKEKKRQQNVLPLRNGPISIHSKAVILFLLGAEVELSESIEYTRDASIGSSITKWMLADEIRFLRRLSLALCEMDLISLM
ncbi:hypothetical protein HNY73_019319 [Argiope bruennichi]|uniref:Uncharacterized protein n=1 Tax=Argiope bruennichi TaxID=94029 RepID=A0A8T0EJB1_ARGBR|nr:hypothetical protein HNY73_019319 [Argiope bruennichi]